MRLKQSQNLVLAILFVLCFALFSSLAPRNFLGIGNLQSMAFQLPELGLLSLAMVIPLITGGINLSLIANANLFGVVTMLVFAAVGAGGAEMAAPWHAVLMSVGAGFLAAIAVGVANGMVIAYIGVSPILATLGTMTLVSGINVLITRGYTFSGVPDSILFVGNGLVAGVPMPMILFISAAGLVTLLLRKTRLGYSLYMLGSNAEATKYSGIDNEGVIVKTYVISSLLSIVAAVIMMGRFNSAKADYGESYLLVTVLASVLGGVSPFGGFGSVLGVVFALLILQVIGNGFNLLGVDPNLSVVVWGLILVVAMGIRSMSESLALQRIRKSAKMKD